MWKQIKVNHRSEFMRLVREGVVDQLASKLGPLLAACNCVSFPTIELQITSPMEGLVPIPVKPVRWKFGGEIFAADREDNVDHVPVARPSGHEVRRISFQRLWNVLYDPTDAVRSHREQTALRTLVREKLNA